MKKTVLVLIFISILSKILGFGRELVLSYIYGASYVSDVYLISITIPTVVFSFITAGISTTYVPMYNKILKEQGEEESKRFSSNLINMLIFICSLFFIVGYLFTEKIIILFASGFEGNTMQLAIQFTRISLISIYSIGITIVLTSLLQINKNFIIPSIIGFPMNIVIIVSIILSKKTSLYVLPIGIVASHIAQLILLLPFVLKMGFRYKLNFNIKDKNIIRMIYMAIPVIIGVSVNQINTLIDRTLASQISIGGISALNYANRLNGFIQGIFVLPISTVMYPTISKMASENNINQFKKTIIQSINFIGILIVPATIGAMIFAEPIVRLLFGRGAFDSYAIHMTSYALFFYSLGMIGFALREVLSRAFYSLEDTKTSMINATIAIAINIILNLILSKYMGIGGLALATSISAIFCTALLFISLRRKIGSFGMKNTIISFIKILIASLIMGAIAKLSYSILLNKLSANLVLMFSIAIGAFTYFALIYFMKIDEVDNMVNLVKSKLKEKLSSRHV